MRYVRLFAALLVACISIVPALSMQDNGIALKECAKQMESPCQKSLMSEKAPDLPQQGQTNAMADNHEGNFAPKSMMDGREGSFGEDPCQDRRMNQNRDGAPKSIMDGKQLNPFCKMPQAGQDDKIDPEFMMYCREGPRGQNSENPQSDKIVPKSMMDGKRNPCDQNPRMGHNMGSMNDIVAPR
jgi:hypothetical protein